MNKLIISISIILCLTFPLFAQTDPATKSTPGASSDDISYQDPLIQLLAKDPKKLENFLITAIHKGSYSVKAKSIEALVSKDPTTVGENVKTVLVNYAGLGINFHRAKDLDAFTWIVRETAAIAVGKVRKIEKMEHVANLVDVLIREETTQVRLALIWALGEIGNETGMTVMVPAIMKEAKYAREPIIRLAAVKALGRIASGEATEVLLYTYQEATRKDIRDAALESLKIIMEGESEQ